MLYSRSLLVTHFIVLCIYQSQRLNLFLPAFPPETIVCFLHLWLYLLFYKSSFVLFLDYKLYHLICGYLTSLSTALSKARPCCCKWHYSVLLCGWLILYWLYAAHLYPFLFWWTFRLLPCLAVVNSAAVNIGYMYLVKLRFSPYTWPGVGSFFKKPLYCFL